MTLDEEVDQIIKHNKTLIHELSLTNKACSGHFQVPVTKSMLSDAKLINIMLVNLLNNIS